MDLVRYLIDKDFTDTEVAAVLEAAKAEKKQNHEKGNSQ